jgi:hypothetical protein
MTLSRKSLSLLTGLVLAVAGGTSAQSAVLTYSGSVGGAPTGTILENFNALPLGAAGGGPLGSGITVSFQTDAQAVSGASNGFYAAPFLSNNNGVIFGDPNGADASVYITTGSTGAFATAQATLDLGGMYQYFGLLWGSIDAYNTLDFYSGAMLLGSITGAQVTAGANGNQGVNGTLYVNINSDTPFDQVVMRSSQYAFEFDNVALNSTPIPEPASLAILGLGLLGLGAMSRARRKAA